jgi:hypothetical protein
MRSGRFGFKEEPYTPVRPEPNAMQLNEMRKRLRKEREYAIVEWLIIAGIIAVIAAALYGFYSC